MLKNKKIRAICACAVLVALFSYIALGGGKLANGIRNGIAYSLQEDFKIKESLGKVFLIENDVPASSGVTVTAFSVPAEGEITAIEVMGETCIEVDTDKFDPVFAVADGVIEKSDIDRITIRHDDGKLSVYLGVGSFTGVGDKVKKGDNIGYAIGTVVYKLYENCVAVDPMIYIVK